MIEISYKKVLNKQTVLMDIHAPLIAQSCKAGQFIIFRVDELGERVPLTICDADKEKGSIRIVFQTIGKSTSQLGELKEGEKILDVVGPLGHPTDFEGYQKVCIVVGGLGSAIGLMSAKQLSMNGVQVDLVAGFRSKELVILEEEMKGYSQNFYLCTDDGSAGERGFVTEKLRQLCQQNSYDLVLTMGPLPMMKFVAQVTRDFSIKTIASMNPIMVDGSGMCGGCRLTVGGKMLFACVDGPDFDAHEVDFDELIIRNQFYQEHETKAHTHYCQLTKEFRSHE
jgi:ferredoxin--NADP+ reductase